MTARIHRLSRWRALLRQLYRTAPWASGQLAVLLVVVGVVPTVLLLVTGQFVAAIPNAARHGLDSPGGTAALMALAGLVAGQALLVIGTTALSQLARALDRRYSWEVHQKVAVVALATPGIAPLEEPAFADRLHVVEESERRGVLRAPITELTRVVSMRIRGIGVLAILFGFRWWAPLLLAAAWHLTNLVYVRTCEKAVIIQRGHGANQFRRVDYLRSLAFEPSAAKEIRVFGLGGWVVSEYVKGWLEEVAVIWSNRRANRRVNALIACALGVAHVAVLGALVMAASRGEVGVAALFVFVQAVLGTSDLGLIGDSQWWLAQSLATAEQVDSLASRRGADGKLRRSEPVLPEVLPRRQPALQSKPRTAAGRALTVRFAGVRFRYPGRERFTLDGLTLHVPAGQSLAIVGENGAGKTTLIKILCGLYEPEAGRVTLDDMAPVNVRHRIGGIFQEFVRYKLPLRENVGFGCLPLLHDQEALDDVLRDAGGAGILARLAKGWDTVLSRHFVDGTDLSGGEWQRIALARALTAVRGGAGLLILDEPTANLDVRGETELFTRLLEHTRDITTILVSHRLSSVRRADRIVVLHEGRIVEDGTHDELMRRGERYAAMFTLQAQRFVAAGPARDEETAHA